MKRLVAVIAVLLLAQGAAQAQPYPLRHVDLSSPKAQAANRYSTLADSALARGDARLALSLSEQGLRIAPNDGWLHYARAAALAMLDRVDEAVVEYRAAERLFDRNDAWARSVAIYGRAQALANVGRCGDAAREFNAYAAYVAPYNPGSAEAARAYAASCPTGSPAQARQLAALAAPGSFEASVAELGAEVAKVRAPGMPFSVRRALDQLADAFERIPNPAQVDVVGAARSMRVSGSLAVLASPGQADRNLATKRALTAAARSAEALASGPYRADPEVHRRADELAQAALAIPESTTLRHAPLAPLIVAFERATLFLKTVAASPIARAP